MDQFIHLITTALQSNDNNLRSQAENQLLQYRDSNPDQFFLKCAQVVQEQSLNLVARQSAGTVASRLINMKNNNNGKFYWDEVSPNIKEQIKNIVLGVLISPTKQIMKTGAMIIAVIASIELVRGQWELIIDVLAENCKNQDIPIKTASVTTLGFICEQIRNTGNTINDRLSEQTLGAIIVSSRQNQTQEITKTALKALQNSLAFLESLIMHAKYRDTVFQLFAQNFRNEIQVQDTYQALFEFVKVASPYLSSYRKSLVDLTEAHLERRDQYSILNLQMWDIIGYQFAQKEAKIKERIGNNQHETNFMQSVSDDVLPNIMKCLLIMNKDEENQENLRNSAARAIESFVKVCDKRVVDLITGSINNVISSPDPYTQQATVVLFSTICEYPDRDYIVDLFAKGFEHFFGLVTSNNKVVIKSSLIGFVRLSQTLPEVFLTHPNVAQIMQTIFKFLSLQKQHKELRADAVQILANVSEGLKYNPHPVSDDPNILLKATVQFHSNNMVRLHTEQPQLNEKLVTIIMNIVMYTNKRDIITQLIDFMLIKYPQVVNQNVPNSYRLVQQVLSVLHTAIMAQKNAIGQNDIFARIIDLIDFHINKYGIETQGLNLLSSTATTYGKYFQNRVHKYWHHVRHALTMVNDLATYKAALACTGDFARVMQSGFISNATEVMKQLLEHIKSNIDREVKLSIISCIGDLILSLQQYGQVFLDDVLSINDICFQAVYQLSNNEKEIEYTEQLKTNLIELQSCLVFAMNSPKSRDKLFEHFGPLATFVVRTCDKNVHPTMEYLRNCLYLIHDSAAIFWSNPHYQEKIREITESNQIKELSRLLTRFEDRPQIKELLNFIESRRKF